jgi:hypothetical protein
MPLAQLTGAEPDGAAVREKLNPAIEKASLVDLKADAADLEAAEANAAELRSRMPVILPFRPGDGREAFTTTLDGGDPTALAYLTTDDVSLGSEGAESVIYGSGIRAQRVYTAFEPGRTYRARIVGRRRSNTSDPSGDAVIFGVAYYSQSKNYLSQATVYDFEDLRTSDGRQEKVAALAFSAGDDVDLVIPANARYGRAFVQTYGTDGSTAAQVLEIKDSTDLAVFPEASGALAADVAALQALDIGARLEAAESTLTTPLTQRFPTISDAAAAMIPVSTTTVETLGYTTTADGGGALYKKAAGEPTHDGKFQSADGEWWELSERMLDPRMFGAVPSNSGFNNHPAFLSALTAGKILSRPVMVGFGDYYFATKLSFDAGNSKMVFLGFGRGATRLIWTNADGGLHVTFTAERLPPRWNGFSLITTYAGGGTAFGVYGPNLSSSTGIGFDVYDLEVRGLDTTSQYWSYSGLQYRLWYSKMQRFTVKGADQAFEPFLAGGIVFSECQVPCFEDFTIFHVTNGLQQAGAVHGEGVTIRGPFEIVGVSNGINLTGAGGTSISGGHINAYSRGIIALNKSQLEITGMLIYKTNISSADWVGIEAKGATSLRIHHNEFQAIGATVGACNPIVVTDNSADCEIDHNRFDNIPAGTTCITLGSGVTAIKVNDNQAPADCIPVAVNSDAGTTDIMMANNFPPPIDTTLVNTTGTFHASRLRSGTIKTANTTATAFLGFVGGYDGQEATLLIDDVYTSLTHNLTTLDLKGDLNVAAGVAPGGVLTMRRIGGTWREVSRSW